MATSIYFTESKDFKLIRERILSQESDYLVYVYADTSNIKIPKDLIKELPIYGNNLIWVNMAEFDHSQLVNHVILTIGQYLMADDPIEFYIVSKTNKFDKALGLLLSEGVIAEVIAPAEVSQAKKKPGRRGRPKTVKTAPAKPVATEAAEAPKRRGRPPKAKPAEEIKTDAAPKKRGRKPGRPKSAPVVTKEKKATKTRKPREEKAITPEEVTAKLKQFSSKDGDVMLIQKKLFGMGKVKRPKFDGKLSEMIQADLAIGSAEAETLIAKMKETGMMDNSGKGGRLLYKD